MTDRVPNLDLTRSEAIALIDSAFKGVAFSETRRRRAVSKLKIAAAGLDAERRARRREERRWMGGRNARA